MIRAHTEAVRALLADLRVYVTRADASAPLPYVVLHPDNGAGSTSSLSGDTDIRDWRPQTTCVGSTVDQAQALDERVEARLLDVVPVVSGRSCGPLRKVTALPVARDEDLPTPVFVARAVWAFRSVSA